MKVKDTSSLPSLFRSFLHRYLGVLPVLGTGLGSAASRRNGPDPEYTQHSQGAAGAWKQRGIQSSSREMFLVATSLPYVGRDLQRGVLKKQVLGPGDFSIRPTVSL